VICDSERSINHLKLIPSKSIEMEMHKASIA